METPAKNSFLDKPNNGIYNSPIFQIKATELSGVFLFTENRFQLRQDEIHQFYWACPPKIGMIK